MLKDIVIAILAGIAIAQRLIQPGEPGIAAAALAAAVMAFMVLLELEDLWDKRAHIRQQAQDITAAVAKGASRIRRSARSRIRWGWLRVRTYPLELAQRRRRRQMMRDYIQRLRQLPAEVDGSRHREPEEGEA